MCSVYPHDSGGIFFGGYDNGIRDNVTKWHKF
nr:MAG TPA: hypothetical protein [Caudoviricetes sp.]DAO01446.1 MAG TPA: hypothetical protein [Caudoviricetes sp.]DAX31489.1 MAG TPA: hypothetical protein [Caudoviricetes sp.]